MCIWVHHFLYFDFKIGNLKFQSFIVHRTPHTAHIWSNTSFKTVVKSCKICMKFQREYQNVSNLKRGSEKKELWMKYRMISQWEKSEWTGGTKKKSPEYGKCCVNGYVVLMVDIYMYVWIEHWFAVSAISTFEQQTNE